MADEKKDWTRPLQADRKRPMVTMTLAPETKDRLDRMAKARGVSRSQVVEALILAAPIREPK